MKAKTKITMDMYATREACEKAIQASKAEIQIIQERKRRLFAIKYPLHEAAEKGDIDTMKQLIYRRFRSNDISSVNKYNADGLTPLHLACIYGHIEIIKYLLKNGADAAIPDDNDGYLPIHYAVQLNHARTTKVLDLLLPKLPTVDVVGPYNQTALHLAAFYGNLPAVRWLVAHGADVNMQEKNTSRYGRTPLHILLTATIYHDSHTVSP